MNCSVCGKKIGLFSNYGNTDKPFCYDCAGSQCCDECKCSIPIGEQVTIGSKVLCRKCNTLVLQDKNVTEEDEPVQENRDLIKDYIRFDTDPLYFQLMSSLTVIIAILLLLNHFQVFTSNMATSLYIAITLTTLFLVILIAGIKIRKNSRITVTRDSLLIRAQLIPVKSITGIEITDSQFVTFCYTQNGENRKKNMCVNSIVPEQQERFKLWVKEFQSAFNGKK
jgi:hypothetical protein